MKKWLLICFILFFPMGLFAFMSAHNPTQLMPDSQAAYAQSKPSVYKFTSPMCKDCMEMQKLLNTVEPMYASQINFVNYNVTQRDNIMDGYIKKYNLKVVPTLLFFDSNGNMKDKVEGVMTRQDLERRLKALNNNG